MTKSIFSLFFASLVAHISVAQETFPVNGVHDIKPIYYAFTNASIYKSATEFVLKGTLLIKDGKVIAAGTGIEIPAGTVVKNCEGLTIYPSFIDIYAGFNNPKKGDKTAQVAHSHWNPSIHPEHGFAMDFPIDEKVKNDWLASGFGVVNVHHRDGIMRGSAQLFHLGIDQPNLSLIDEKSTAHFSFAKGSSKEDYPSSHIGAVALLRQSLYDANWYTANKSSKKENTEAYQEMKSQESETCVFELSNPLALRNVRQLEMEFKRSFTVKGTGKEYMLPKEEVESRQIIVPINFPKVLDVSDPYLARMVSLSELKHWEAAPFNAHFLNENGAIIALSRDTISSQKEFLANLKKLTESGFDHTKTLVALTSTPAKMLGLESMIGDLTKGKLANFFIANGRFDQDDFAITEHYNKGELVFRKPLPNKSLVGSYNLVIDNQNIDLNIEKVTDKGAKASANYKGSPTKLKAKVEIDNQLVTMVLSTDDTVSRLVYQMTGKLSLQGSVWDGQAQDNQGNWITWAAVKNRKSEPKKAKTDSLQSDAKPPSLMMPNMAFGYYDQSAKNTFVVTNAKVWTSGPQGFLQNADVYVVDGKIKSVGKDEMFPSDVVRINANGKHLTPGIIDEHSHIGIFGGVNEWAHSSSAEVRIADAIDPWNINIYRQLAGGVTAAQLLHGSANPIGGQSALIEMKWGTSADEMLIDNAPGFIKFALGENVKRSNYRPNSGRFPNTRMGVEQTFADGFIRAKEYSPEKSESEHSKEKGGEKADKKSVKRTDLELEALAEILRDERYISCHSYVQSEILMLMNLADSFGFKVNTFTHILEGYKVADQMVKHGASGSTFSDWWAYKFEVNDAIPYNAALMHQAGINVGINSDDAEMGRRLNQEAAKTVKYGGVSEEDALKMITINPAKMLHLDDRMGSIEEGKQANLVLWSDHPLSIYSHPEKTFINGVTYFDKAKEDQQNLMIQRERARLISLMISDKSDQKEKPTAKKEEHYHCDTVLENYWEN